MAQPIIEFRSATNPFPVLASLPLTGGGTGGAIVAGQTSNVSLIRIYNNFVNAGGISDAVNCVLAAYDDGTHWGSSLTVPVTQQWLQAQVIDYNGSTTSADTSYFPLGGTTKHAVPLNGGVLNGKPIANPGAQPVLTAVSGSTPLLAGTYTVGYTYISGPQGGETLLSPTQTVTITAGQGIQVGAITPPPDVTAVNYYLSIAANNSTVAFDIQGSGAQVTLTALPAGGAASPPVSNGTTIHYFEVNVRAAPPSNATVTNIVQGLWLEYSWT